MNARAITQAYLQSTRLRALWLVAFALMLVLALFYALLSGSAAIGPAEVWSVLAGNADEITVRIVWDIRMPRALAALLAGLALSVSGAVMQSILRNPLASPFTLGISGAAAFGAAFAIVFTGAGTLFDGSGPFMQAAQRYAVMASAFVWSMASTLLILGIARLRGTTPEIMVLSGIAIGSLFGAGVSAMQYLATEVELAAIVFWMFGDLGRASWHDVSVLTVVLVPVIGFMLIMSWNYKALQSGDELAGSLGLRPGRIRLGGMLGASLATAVVVSFYGVIAFVGLVVPHMVRRLVGEDERFLLPASALFGALFLLVSDTVARTLFSPVVLPVGILTSFIGAPLFLFLLLRGMRIHES